MLKVAIVRCDKNKPVDVCNGGNLSIDEWHGPAQRFEPGAFCTVPLGGSFIVGKIRKGSSDDILQVRLERRPSLAARQPATPIRQLVPDRRGDRTFKTIVFEALEDTRVGFLRDRCGDDARIEKILDRHSVTLRPAVLSRTDAAKSVSTPTSSREYFFKNLR